MSEVGQLSRRFIGLWFTLVAAMSGIGLSGSLLGLRAEHEDFATLATGAMLASYYIGFPIGSRLAAVGIRRVGHVRAYIGFATANAAVPLIHSLLVHPVPWSLLRIMTGLCIAGTYVIAESWLNHDATNTTRGRVMAIYMAVCMGGVVAGLLLLNVASPGGYTLFVISAALFLASIVPLVLIHPPEPPADNHESMSARALFALVPAGVLSALCAGVVFGGIGTMASVYASRVGMSTGQTSIFLAVGTVGSVLLAWPINSWSDRSPRATVIVAVCVAGGLSALTMWVIPARSLLAYALFFVLSGCGITLYSLSVVYTQDQLVPSQRVAASSALIDATAVGSIIGPLIAAASMASRLGPKGFFAVFVAAFALTTLLVSWRIRSQTMVSAHVRSAP